jgi:hypothetical protein
MSTSVLQEKLLRDEAYAAHRREQLQRQASLPFAEKLQWLEDAHRMVLALQQSRESQADSQEAPASTCTELE